LLGELFESYDDARTCERQKPKYSDKSMSHCYSVNHHVTGTGLGSKAELQAESPDTKQSNPRHGLSANDI